MTKRVCALPVATARSHGEVVDRHDADIAAHVTVRLLPADRARFERRQ